MQDDCLLNKLLAQYCFLVDQADAEEISQLFWDDAILTFGETKSSGREEIKAWYSDWIVNRREPVAGLRHRLYSPWLVIDGDTSNSKAYYDADGHSVKTGRYIQVRGVYVDTLQRRHGQWRFLSREIQVWRSP